MSADVDENFAGQVAHRHRAQRKSAAPPRRDGASGCPGELDVVNYLKRMEERPVNYDQPSDSDRPVNDVISLLQDLVRIPSDEREAEVLACLAERFDRRGISYSVREVAGAERSNIVATWGEGEPSLILNSHMDTVGIGDRAGWHYDPYGAQIDNGCMYGRGTADAKGPLAAMVVAFESITAELDPHRGRLVLMAVAKEESGGTGTELAVGDGLRAGAAIVGEPTGLEVLTAHKGAFRADITVHGVAAHSSEPWEGRNAVFDAPEVIVALRELSRTVAGRSDPLVGRASLEATVIRGGIARNVIPPSCTLTLDRRILPGESMDDVREEILTALEPVSREVEISFEPVSRAESAVTPAGEPIVTTALSAREAEPKGFPACCDMWYLTNRGKIPTVILGPGSLQQAHKSDEHIALDDLRQAVHIYRRIILDWFGRK